MEYSANCKCGKVAVLLSISHDIENLEPRECDCDFCSSHELIYLSESNGKLSIEAHDTLKQLKQGSEQAIFWQCVFCDQIIAVTSEFEGKIKGAVNGKLFAKDRKLKTPITVSPKLLSATEKRARWQTMWLTVNFNIKTQT